MIVKTAKMQTSVKKVEFVLRHIRRKPKSIDETMSDLSFINRKMAKLLNRFLKNMKDSKGLKGDERITECWACKDMVLKRMMIMSRANMGLKRRRFSTVFFKIDI